MLALLFGLGTLLVATRRSRSAQARLQAAPVRTSSTRTTRIANTVSGMVQRLNIERRS
jgi:hypothetical protein